MDEELSITLWKLGMELQKCNKREVRVLIEIIEDGMESGPTDDEKAWDRPATIMSYLKTMANTHARNKGWKV